MKPRSAFTGTGTRIRVPSALTPRSPFSSEIGAQSAALALRSALVQTPMPRSAVPSEISSAAIPGASSSVV